MTPTTNPAAADHPIYYYARWYNYRTHNLVRCIRFNGDSIQHHSKAVGVSPEAFAKMVAEDIAGERCYEPITTHEPLGYDKLRINQ